MLNIINSNTHLKEYKLITFLNPYSYVVARQHKELFKNFYIMIDSFVLVYILNLINIKIKKRNSFDMSSLAPVVFQKAIDNNSTMFIIGTTQETINKSLAILKSNYPNLNIIGHRHGYFESDIERLNYLKYLKELNPEIVICGMGSIVQEAFLLDLKLLGWSGTGYTCGGFLHQLSNSLKYYPDLINKYNLRWLYRLYKEPHTRKRFFIYYPKFFYLFIYDYLKYKKMHR